MHYYVVGVNATGKTSLMKAVAKRTGMDYIHGTGVLMERLGIGGDYDALRALDQNYVLQKWGETARDLVKEYDQRSFLLDTHIMNLTNGTVIRRDGPWIGAYDALVLVTAPTEEILERVGSDISRQRALFPVDITTEEQKRILNDYQNQTEKLFRELAVEYDLPTIVIENNTGQFEKAVEQFIAAVSALK